MPDDEARILSKGSRALSRGLRQASACVNPEASISVLLADLAQGVGAQRAAVFERGRDGIFACTYAWHADGLQPLSASHRTIPLTPSTRAWLAAVEAGQAVAVDNLGPDAVRDQDLLALLDATGVQRFAAYPLPGAGGTRGLVVFYDLPLGRARMVDPVLRSTASSLAMLAYRRDGMEAVAQPDQLDRVTGLSALGAFSHEVNDLIAAVSSGSTETPWAMAYLDVADFKAYNSTHGFAAGDEILRRLGHTICDVMGSTRVCRYDADRFYAVLEDARAEAAVRQVHATAKSDPALGVEVRAGIYRITGEERGAVQAMDRAKMAGDAAYGDYEHYWRRFDPQMERALSMRGYVISHVDQAIASGWVKAFYQPVVGTLSGKVEGVEALARWDDPAHGLLPPASFIDTLERGHLVYKLDLEVLRQACEMLGERRSKGQPFVPVSVNISRTDLEVEDIHDRIDAILATYAIPHSNVHIEITETALAQSEDLVRTHVDRFHQDGYEVWLDDFGSGYSSLNTLQHFDFDCVKIDMAFLHDGAGTPNLAQFMGDIVTLAKHRGLRTLAEGVETQDQYAMLKEIGCMLAQGYLFSQPRPADALEEALRARGMSLASAGERLVYGRLGMTDVAEGTYPFPDEGAEDGLRAPVALVINCDENLRLVYANEPCLARLRDMGIDGVAEAEDRINSDGVSAALLRSCMRRTVTPGSVAKAHLSVGDWAGRLRLQLVVAQGDLRAYLLTADDEEPSGDRALAADLRGVSSLFDEVLFLSPREDRVRPMQMAAHLAPDDLEDRGLAGVVDWMAHNLVHPSQAARLAQMLDPATLVERVSQAPAGILDQPFDVRMADKAYELRRVVVARLPSPTTRPELVLCVARDRAGWTHSLPGQTQTLPNGRVESAQVPSAKALWDAAVSGDTIGIFWKDSDRRFLGANQMFLSYYGIRLEDILGKTDEDMGWHPDPEPYRRDELRVLQRGDTVRDAPGVCLVHGRPRDITATKVPIYQDGKIVGLFGYFLDVTSVRARMDAVHRRTADSLRGGQLTDAVTGLANATGIREGCRRLEEAFDTTGSDFGYVCIQILGMHQFETDYGTATCENLHRSIARHLRSVASEGDQVGRVYDGRYVIIASPCDGTRLAQLEEAVPDALSRIREVDGISCTVYCMMGTALYSASNDYGLMTATAEAGMMAGLAQDGVRAYTRAGAARALRDSTPAWDLVRLVDPLTMTATMLGDDGNFRRLPGSCSELLGKSTRCQNCASLKALQTGQPQRKVESLGDRHYYIVAQPVTVDGRSLVIERMAEVKGAVLADLQKRGG